MIWISFATIILIFALAYLTFNKDLFSPCPLFFESFSISLFIAALYKERWGQGYSFVFYSFIFLHLIVFMFFSAIVKYVVLGKRRVTMQKEINYKIYKFQQKTWLLLGIDILVFALYFYEIYRLAGIYGNTKGISGMFYVYHNKVLLNNDGSGEQMRTWIVLLFRFSTILAYYSSYIFLNNLIRARQKLVKNLKWFLFVLVYWSGVFISSQRTGIIYHVFAMIFMAYIMMRQKNGWVKGEAVFIKMIQVSVIVLFASVVGLFTLGNLMGRVSNVNPVDYFAVYCAGSIPNLSKVLSHSGVSFFMGTTEPIAQHFYSYSGARANLYTIFGEIVASEGWLSSLAFSIYISLLYSIVYYLTIYERMPSIKSDFFLIVYAYATEGLLMGGLVNVINNNIITKGFVLIILGIWFIHYFVVNKKIRIKVR